MIFMQVVDILAISASALLAYSDRDGRPRRPASERRFHERYANPNDWRATRRLLKEKYALYGGMDMRDRNGVKLNGASVVAALLYGKGDWVETVRHALNFGWDADNNAATAGCIVGVVRGWKWMMSRCA